MNGVYSIHTFFFPFVWENDTIDMAGIFSHGGQDSIWEAADTSMQSSNFSRSVFVGEMDPAEYNAFHYFNEAGRNLVFSDGEKGLIHSFRVRNDIVSDTQYVITKGSDRYALDITGIFLHVFSTGTAVVELKCRNSAHRSLAAVKAINEYGRRLALPYWMDNGSSKCADSLEISGPHLHERDDFRSFDNGKVSFCYISRAIRRLLDRNGAGVTFRARSTSAENEIQIRSVVDEKMYDCCLLIDRQLADALATDLEAGNGTFGSEMSAELNELMFVDLQGSCSGRNPAILGQKLDGRLFLDDLFRGAPKLSAVTDQAYIKVIGEPDFDVDYFQNIYTKIILLGLVQRMSIAKFSTTISRWTNELRQPGKKLTMRRIKSIMKLQEDFVTFQNQYILSEVTVKTEGRFLYDRIRAEMNIQGEYDDITGQINSLYELVSTAQGDSFNKWGLVLSLIALELTVAGTFITAGDVPELSALAVLLIDAAAATAIIWLVVGVVFRKKRR